MSIPKFDQTFLPILKVVSDGKTYRSSEIPEKILSEGFFKLDDTERQVRTSTGANLFNDRVAWGKSYLKLAGLLEQPSRGLVKITDKGLALLHSGITHFDLKDLKKDKDYQEYNSKPKGMSVETKIEDLSPQDLVDQGFSELKSKLKKELLDKLYTVDFNHFELIILKLFQKMGYGKFEVTKKTRDGGIDGVLNQDELGIDKIYTQAKRYAPDNKVHGMEMQNFIGALSGEVRKGIFVTTSNFDPSAIKKAQDAHNVKIRLIDGEELAELMIKHNIGIQTINTYEIKQLDEDFFESA